MTPKSIPSAIKSLSHGLLGVKSPKPIVENVVSV